MFLSADKFGYYTVGDRKTYSKFEAIQWQQSTGLFPNWNFNRSVYDNVNWKVEPSIDLWSLYKERARQIRESYDYVVLWYSGGSDSHNFLLAWLDAGLKIDEIAATWNYEVTGDLQNHYNAEITNVVLPDIERLQKAGFDFKFRLVDSGKNIVELFSDFNLDFEYFVNRHFSLNNPARHTLREKVDDYRNMITAGKKLCFVWGLEKPTLYYDNGRYYTQFTDQFDNVIGPYVQQRFSQGWYDEAFYWSPDMPSITVKQAHILKNFVSTVNDEHFYQDKPSQYGYNADIKKYLTVETVKILLYPKWKNSIFCNGKAASMVYSERDSWFFDSNLAQHERFDNIVASYFKTIGNFWANDEKDYLKGIKGHISPRYYLN
jgi:hypothetical protein